MTAAGHPVPATQPARHRRAHAPADHRPRLRPWIVFTAAVIVAFFGLIYSRISLDRSAFELDELTEAIAVEERRAHDLEAEQARLQDPARIGSLAVEMGMVYPLTRVALHAPENTDAEIDPDLRWAQLEGLLSARP